LIRYLARLVRQGRYKRMKGEAMPSPTTVNGRKLWSLVGSSIAAPLLAPRIAVTQEAWPARTVRYDNGLPAGYFASSTTLAT
jgi:hypothetical protein